MDQQYAQLIQPLYSLGQLFNHDEFSIIYFQQIHFNWKEWEHNNNTRTSLGRPIEWEREKCFQNIYDPLLIIFLVGEAIVNHYFRTSDEWRSIKHHLSNQHIVFPACDVIYDIS